MVYTRKTRHFSLSSPRGIPEDDPLKKVALSPAWSFLGRSVHVFGVREVSLVIFEDEGHFSLPRASPARNRGGLPSGTL